MIHFDTNILIALPELASSGHPVVDRVLSGEQAAACAVVWYEFLQGPLADDEADLARAFLEGRIAPVTEREAQLGARLFNEAGRRRALKTDALIAACAISADANFITANVADFEPFVAHGLRLMPAAS